MAEDLKIQSGETYVRKRGTNALFRKVITISGRMVTYERLHLKSSQIKRLHRIGTCSIKQFYYWADSVVTKPFEEYFGKTKENSHILHDDKGIPIVSIGDKTLSRYLAKGLVVLKDEQYILQEVKIKASYAKTMGGIEHPYLLEPKHDRCVVCGCNTRLTRHHVVPKHMFKKLPSEIKPFIIGLILCMCEKCHQQMEAYLLTQQLPDPPSFKVCNTEYIRALKKWLEYYKLSLSQVKPKFIPKSWDLTLSKQLTIAN